MIRKGRCMCMQSECDSRYQEFDISDALFCVKNINLTINHERLFAAEAPSTGYVGTLKSPYSDEDEDDMQNDMRGSFRPTQGIFKDVDSFDLYFAIKKGKIECVEIKTSQSGIRLKSIELDKEQKVSNQYRTYRVICVFECNGKPCDPIRTVTDGSLYCPKCKTKLPWHMGFCDCFIIMPVGNKDYGKTTFLQAAYSLSYNNKMKIGNYRVFTGKKGGDSKQNVNHRDEHEWTWDNLQMDNWQNGTAATTNSNEDIFAYFLVNQLTTQEETLFIFRDNAGEFLAEHSSEKLNEFVRKVDVILFFSYPYTFTQVKNTWNEVKDRLKKNMKDDFSKDKSKDDGSSMTNQTFEVLDSQKSQLKNKAGMFVLTMTDKLLEKEPNGNTVIDDLAFGAQSNGGLLISSHSILFDKDAPFNIQNYYQCAFESAYLLNNQEEYYRQFMNFDKTWKLGATAISSLKDHTMKIDYVFGWLIMCLLEDDGKYFKKPLAEQSPDDFKDNPLY